MPSSFAQSEVLLFDYDGVLANTEPLHWAAWQKVLAPFGIDLTWDLYSQHCRGVADVKMRDALQRIFGQAVDLPDLSPYLDVRRRLVCEWSQFESPISAETIGMLQKLADRRLGLVTSAEREDVEPVLRSANIQNCFEVCIFGGDVERHKPAPDPYLMIASRMGTSAGIAFEDSDSGMISALEAGFRAVRVSDPADLPKIVAGIIEG
jgi:beta-phosphoglucomutase